MMNSRMMNSRMTGGGTAGRRLVLLLALAISLWGASPAYAQSGDIPLSTINVTGESDGTAKEGYVVKEVKELGPWSEKALLDTPYTVNIVTEDYIENIQARSPGELLDRIPGVNRNGGGSEHNFQHTANIRGFATAGSSSARFNGVPTGNNNVATFLEDVESLEIIHGLSGFMYGSGNVGGSFNYNLKRPTYDYMNKLRFGTYGNELFYGHADLGGPIAGGLLAYRINILAEKGEGPVKPQNLTRQLLSVALDWNPTEDLQFQFNASHGEIELQGREGGFYVEDNNLQAFVNTDIDRVVGYENAANMVSLNGRLPGPPDPSQLKAPLDFYNNYDTNNLGLGVKYKINDRLKFRAAAAYNDFDRDMVWGNFFFTVDPDVYKYDVRGSKMFYRTHGAYAYLDGEFETAGIEHKLTVGANGYSLDVFTQAYTYAPGGPSQLYYYGSRFSNPALAWNNNIDALGIMNNIGPRGHKNSDSLNYNLLISDDVKFNDQWELMVGLNNSTIRNRSYNAATGVKSSEYNKSAVTPTVALMFKPIPKLTGYVSYIESLEAGAMVSATSDWLNAGEVLPPLKSRQYEVGVKAEVGGMFLTAALYQIERALQFGDRSSMMYVQDGEQRHRGLELIARGKLTEDLTLMGGVNFLDAEVLRTSDPLMVGKEPTFVPKFAGKIYAEYDLPFVDGLTLTGGLNYFGKVYTNTYNNLQVPAYATADLGLRLATKAFDQDVIYRLNVYNLTNKKYWFGGGNSHLHTGQPRSVALSAEIQF
ncbi:MAG: TonB-dependent receptor [Candidatus Adiutrix sp.]|jgi:iron complex outermembrane receptor protein|nr:TonB-dependent receptor [Candidatus Adiutrix sp.]